MEGTESGGDRPARPGRLDSLDGFAGWAFWAYLPIAYLMLVFWFGWNDWFSYGDWHLLAGPITRDLFTPVEQHWSTLPALIYQAYFRLFGLEYPPFLATVAALHIAIVVLLWVVMRRTDVRPWVAAVSAAPLVLFAPGYVSILAPIQITQNLSLVCGLSQLLLADHKGSIDRRDFLGLTAGAAGLMSSGVMPVLVVATGVATLIRRGWRVAMFHTAPLAAMYVAWFLAYDPTASNAQYLAREYSVGAHLNYMKTVAIEAFSALGGSGAVGSGLALLLVAGLSLRLRRGGFRRALQSLALPFALLACGPFYLAVIGYQRSRWAGYADASHHLYIALVFCLPALACAAAAVVARWRWAAPAVAALLLVGVLPNADFRDEERIFSVRTSWLQTERDFVLTLAHSPELDRAERVNPGWPIFPNRKLHSSHLTVGWLVEQRDAGRIPKPPAKVRRDFTRWLKRALNP